MCQKIRYWLVPVWAIGLAIAIFFLCEKLIQDDGTGPKWLIFLIFSPLYLLFIWSYIKGLKIFSLPKPSVKNFIVGILAVVFFIPLVINFALFAALLGDYGELEPLSGLIFSVLYAGRNYNPLHVRASPAKREMPDYVLSARSYF